MEKVEEQFLVWMRDCEDETDESADIADESTDEDPGWPLSADTVGRGI